MSYQLISSEKMNQDFRGHAEKCTWEFTVALPEQIFGVGWTAQQLINAHVNELQSQGSILLELRVWEDTSPTWTTNYRVETVASASPLWWNLIIVGVLAIVAIIAIYLAITKVEDIAEYLGDAAPVTLPIIALTGLAAAVAVAVYFIRRPAGGKT